MDYINDLLADLSARLPELEWKMSSYSAGFSSHSLPKGLFKFRSEFSGPACIAEIKADIDALAKQTNQRSASYLALRIKQKINVLVVLCQMHTRKSKPEEKVHFGLQMISTRQQWIQSLEDDIERLTTQQQAMLNALAQMKQSANNPGQLNLRSELGEVERRLTLAKEALTRAIA